MKPVLKCYLWPWVLIYLFSCDGVAPPDLAAAPGSVVPAESMRTPRSGHSATLLDNGKVLIAGGMNGNGKYFSSAEVFDPRANTFATVQEMRVRRVGHTATLLPNGKVLIAGGFDGGYHASAELYDPATGTFSPTGPLTEPRSEHQSVLLDSGKVLVIGGVGEGYTFLASAEIYDPTTGKFTRTGSMSAAREGHTATLLRNGNVLVAGGHKDRREAMTVYSSCEIYDPRTGAFSRTGDMTVVRHKHAAALLPDGNVLIAGGSDKRDWQGQYSSAEIYDFTKGNFKAVGKLNSARYKLTNAMVVLKDGTVVVAGGSPQVELYEPEKRSFSRINGELEKALFFSSATLLSDGRVLIAGGYDDHGVATQRSWLYRR